MHQHSATGRGIEPTKIQYRFRFASTQEMPFTIRPGFHPCMVIVRMYPSWCINLPCRNTYRAKCRHQQDRFLLQRHRKQYSLLPVVNWYGHIGKAWAASHDTNGSLPGWHRIKKGFHGLSTPYRTLPALSNCSLFTRTEAQSVGTNLREWSSPRHFLSAARWDARIFIK